MYDLFLVPDSGGSKKIYSNIYLFRVTLITSGNTIVQGNLRLPFHLMVE